MEKIFEKITNPAIIILFAAILRIVPHLPNFTPIGAMALFGGAYLGKRSAFVLPFVAMVLSDIFLGFDSLAGRLAVYASFALIAGVGIWLKNHKTIGNVMAASLISSLLFFLITNFTILYTQSLYPKNFSGLMESYTMAIPFFRNTLLGDLFYTTIFFGGYELVLRLVKTPVLIKQKI